MKKKTMDLSIIFVNWNSVDYLREAIASVYDHTRCSFEIIVVDNASPAGDAQLIEEEFHNIQLIKSPTNLGFAGANNLGYRQANGRYILLLNPDTKIIGAAIDEMVRTLETLPDGGILGCRLLNDDLSTQTSCIQSFPTIVNQLLDSNFLRDLWPNSSLWGTKALWTRIDRPEPVEMISGACMLLRREVFEQVGLFSEDYFMYAEDMDLSYKVRSHGYVNYFLGSAQVIHYGGKSSTFESANRMQWVSKLRFFEKQHGRFYTFIFRYLAAISAIVRLSGVAIAFALHKLFRVDSRRDRLTFTKWRIILGIVLGTRSKRIYAPGNVFDNDSQTEHSDELIATSANSGSLPINNGSIHPS